MFEKEKACEKGTSSCGKNSENNSCEGQIGGDSWCKKSESDKVLVRFQNFILKDGYKLIQFYWILQTNPYFTVPYNVGSAHSEYQLLTSVESVVENSLQLHRFWLLPKLLRTS